MYKGQVTIRQDMEAVTSTLEPMMIIRRRPKINMTRMRDRLWDRLALQRNRTMLQQEMQAVLLKSSQRVVDTEGQDCGNEGNDWLLYTCQSPRTRTRTR